MPVIVEQGEMRERLSWSILLAQPGSPSSDATGTPLASLAPLTPQPNYPHPESPPTAASPLSLDASCAAFGGLRSHSLSLVTSEEGDGRGEPVQEAATADGPDLACAEEP